MSSKPKEQRPPRNIWEQAMKASTSNDDVKGKSRGGPPGGKDLAIMRGLEALESPSMPATTFGKGPKGRVENSHGFLSSAATAVSNGRPQPNAHASGSRPRMSTGSASGADGGWEKHGPVVSIAKPTASTPEQYASRQFSHGNPYVPGLNTLNAKQQSKRQNAQPPPQHRNAGASQLTSQPKQRNAGTTSDHHGMDWLGGLAEFSAPGRRPTSTGSSASRSQQPSSSAHPSASTSRPNPSISKKHARPPDPANGSEVLCISSDDDEGPLKSSGLPKSTDADAIGQNQAKRVKISPNRPPLPSPPKMRPTSKSTRQQVHEVSDDDDVDDPIEEFDDDGNLPNPSRSSRPATSSRPHPSRSPERNRSNASHATNQQSIPNKRKELPREDEVEAQPLRSTGVVRKKVEMIDVQSTKQHPSPVSGGIAKKMKGKGGEALAPALTSGPSSSKATPAASNSIPSGHLDKGESFQLQSFAVAEWWKGFNKQTSRVKLVVGNGTFTITGLKGATEMELAYSQLIGMRVSLELPYLICLELTDDGHRGKLIRPVQAAPRHIYAKHSFTFGFNAPGFEALLSFFHEEFDNGKTRKQESHSGAGFISRIDMKAGESQKLLHALQNAGGNSNPILRPETNHPFSAAAAYGSGTRSTRSTTQQTVEIDGSDDEPEVVKPPKTRAARPPCVNPTEVMATWPLTGKGQFDITKGDYYRTLDDVEFLNDTMIEYGLRSALAKAVETFPELAEEVHIFSTFLYTKLSNKKKTKEGDPWEVVARWTRKFDIFQKKFLIVPINEDFHWYLAIIVNPGAVLRPPEEKIPAESTTLTRSRSSGGHVDVDASDLPRSASPSNSSPEVENAESGLANATKTEEDEVNEALEDSRSVKSQEQTGNEVEGPVQRQLQDVEMQDVQTEVRNLSLEPKDGNADAAMEGTNERVPSPRQVDKPSTETAMSPTGPQQTLFGPVREPGFIFTLDSLGSAHPATGKLLNRYLASEAKNRKKLGFEPTPLQTKKLDVPTQPDYSSCGVYMIHYVECLLKNPKGVISFGSVDSRSKAQAQIRDELWRKNDLPDARKRLKESVEGLFEAWKVKRAEEGTGEPVKDPAAGEPSGSVERKPPEADPSVIIEGGPSTAQPSTSKEDQEQQSVASKADKGKGREVFPNEDQKNFNPFARSPTRAEEPPKSNPSPNPFVRPSAPASFHFGADPPPPAQQPAAAPSLPSAVPASPPRPVTGVDFEPVAPSSDEESSEDFRDPQRREEDEVEDYAHGQFQPTSSRLRAREEKAESKATSRASSTASALSEPPLQPVTLRSLLGRPGSPPPPAPNLEHFSANFPSSHHPPPTFRQPSKNLEPPPQTGRTSRPASPSKPPNNTSGGPLLPTPEVPTSQRFASSTTSPELHQPASAILFPPPANGEYSSTSVSRVVSAPDDTVQERVEMKRETVSLGVEVEVQENLSERKGKRNQAPPPPEASSSRRSPSLPAPYTPEGDPLLNRVASGAVQAVALVSKNGSKKGSSGSNGSVAGTRGSSSNGVRSPKPAVSRPNSRPPPSPKRTSALRYTASNRTPPSSLFPAKSNEARPALSVADSDEDGEDDPLRLDPNEEIGPPSSQFTDRARSKHFVSQSGPRPLAGATSSQKKDWQPLTTTDADADNEVDELAEVMTPTAGGSEPRKKAPTKKKEAEVRKERERARKESVEQRRRVANRKAQEEQIDLISD